MWTSLLLLALTAPAAPASSMEELFASLDLSQSHLKPVAALVQAERYDEALSLWRDQVVTRLRAHDFGQYGWHSYVLHPRPAGAVDSLAGIVPREQYLKSGQVGFVDVFGMTGPPGRGQAINWVVDLNGPVDWGDPELARLDLNGKLLKTDFANFEFAKPFVGRFWSTGNRVYLDKCLEIMADLSRNHRRMFWSAYHERGLIVDQEVWQRYRCDWRLNTNGLEVGWRLKNFLMILAGFSKCLGPDKPEEWDDILKPCGAAVSRDRLDLISAPLLADIAVSMMRDHVGKLLWFCVAPGAVPNQRSEGLKAMALTSVILPDFKTTPQLVEMVERGYDDLLESNFLPDGGSLEQSFNYNEQDKEGLLELVRFFGDQRPPYAEKALARVAARKAVDDGLQTPLGSLPQVGNSHQAAGKAVWLGEDILKRYWAQEVEGLAPVRPQAYTSRGYPYSGYYAMRSGWGLKDLYLFFMGGRPQAGHSMRDNNSLQVVAYGRQLVTCAGPPTYNMFRNDDARGADFYLSEQSSLKVNTVLVDGRSQAKDARAAGRAYRTPISARWHAGKRFDLVEGHYDLGYCEREKGRDVRIDKSVAHDRRVIFVKDARLWVVEDRMLNRGDQPHRYSQVWHFPPYCEDARWDRSIAGFREDQLALDEAGAMFRSTDPTGPNIEFRHFGAKVQYTRYFGHKDPWLGWFAAGIGDARPAPEVHASWDSADSDTLITLLIPLDVGQPSPVRAARPIVEQDGAVRGINVELNDGTRLSYRTGTGRTPVPVSTPYQAGTLLVSERPGARPAGLAVAVTAADPQVAAPDAFEFGDFAGEAPILVPIVLPEVPEIEEPPPFLDLADAAPVVIKSSPGRTVRYTTDGSDPGQGSPEYREPFRMPAEGTVKARYFREQVAAPLVAKQEYRAWRWPARIPDRADATGLEPGLRYRVFRFDGGIRLYDLMLQKPVETGECADTSLEPWKDQKYYGVEWTGYLKVARDGLYRFHLHSPSGAYLFLRTPGRDLDLPPVTAAYYHTIRASGQAALRAGYHRLTVQYQQIWNNANVFDCEIEGPGLPRQPLSAAMVAREAG